MLHQFQNNVWNPILLPGHTARLFKADGVVDVFVEAVGGIPSMRVDIGALSVSSFGTASNTGYDATQLDMPDGEFAQYRFIIADDFEVELTHPGTTVRQWKTDSTNARVKPIPASSSQWGPFDEVMWAASEFFVYEQETPRFDIYPQSVSVPRPQGHIEFQGWRFAFRKLGLDANGKQIKGVLPIWVNSWPSGLGTTVTP